MIVIRGQHAEDTYSQLIHKVLNEGAMVHPRDTHRLELRPVSIVVEQPLYRLVGSYGRPVNVTFALVELLWILSGRNDVGMPAFYNSNIAKFSDDGNIFNAAYGDRLRHAHGHDQIKDCIDKLAVDPHSTQATLVMANPKQDRNFELVHGKQQPRATLDRACNVLAHLTIREGKLHWLQVVRSNDAIWGVPYNFMQWMGVMEYMALALGVGLGHYTHVSDSMHIYDYHLEEAKRIRSFDLYSKWSDYGGYTVRMSTTNIKGAAQREAAIRTSNWQPFDAMPFFNDQYWSNVVTMCCAHAAYKAWEDHLALRQLLDVTDRVIASAQMRFYWYHRWHRNADITSLIKEKLPKPIYQWIVDSHT